jgi:hypothetical protein
MQFKKNLDPSKIRALIRLQIYERVGHAHGIEEEGEEVSWISFMYIYIHI